MSGDEQLSSSLQESLLALLSFDDVEGRIAAGLVSPKYFEAPYRDIADRVLQFRGRFKTAPGAAHIDDLFDHVLGDSSHKQYKSYSALLMNLYDISRNLNGPFVLNRVDSFIRRQTLKAAVIAAGDRYQEGTEEGLEDDVEKIFSDAIRHRIDAGLGGAFLNDKEAAMAFLDRKEESFPLGIKQLDHYGIGPRRKRMLALLAPKGRGKSWFVCHCGAQGMLHRKRVAHISLEMDRDEVFQRYMMNLFAVAERRDIIMRTLVDKDEFGNIQGFLQEKYKPHMSFADPNIKEWLGAKMDPWGMRFGKVFVESFPSGTLTYNRLESWLDSLEIVHHFIPDILVLDYPDLMDFSSFGSELREALGRLFVRLRGLAQERNFALVVPAQANREGAKAKSLKGTDIAEDWSKTHTADIVLTYSQTAAEKRYGLARLYVDKARFARDGFEVLLTQSYDTGQFVRESFYMPSSYHEKVEQAAQKADATK